LEKALEAHVPLDLATRACEDLLSQVEQPHLDPGRRKILRDAGADDTRPRDARHLNVQGDPQG
jgi:hypothetical protein